MPGLLSQFPELQGASCSAVCRDSVVKDHHAPLLSSTIISQFSLQATSLDKNTSHFNTETSLTMVVQVLLTYFHDNSVPHRCPDVLVGAPWNPTSPVLKYKQTCVQSAG